jgi:hypothetical protein
MMGDLIFGIQISIFTALTLLTITLVWARKMLNYLNQRQVDTIGMPFDPMSKILIYLGAVFFLLLLNFMTVMILYFFHFEFVIKHILLSRV